MADLDFLKGFEKDLDNLELNEGSSEPPRYWFSTGNYVANKTLSGSFLKGIPQGRVTALVGPSGCGKSFLLSNIMREAQKDGAIIIALDSENALDDEFVSKIGVNPDTKYKYVDVDTIPEVVKVVSSFLKNYKDKYEGDENAPKVLIAIDSLNMLSTETEAENFEKGISKGDQGQTNKQLKSMLKSFVRAIKHTNISIVCTAHVYKNQDVLNGEGVWIVSDAIKFSLSQIAMLTKLKLRQGEGAKRTVSGIELKVEGYKTRFTRPFQTVKIEVPYETGMNPFNGLFEVAIELGIITKKGSWYVIGDGDNFRQDDFFTDEFESIRNDVLVKCEAANTKFLEANLKDMEEVVEAQPSAKSQREKKAKGE
jgi:recombination protein RecA